MPLDVDGDDAKNSQIQPCKSVAYFLRREQPPEEKYFHEPGNDDILGHYDTRFFKGAVTYEERTDTLREWVGDVDCTWDVVGVVVEWEVFFRAEGCFLGTGILIPKSTPPPSTAWPTHSTTLSTDTTSQTTRPSANTCSMSTRTPADATAGQGQNIIDARWIDMRNGLYIDITGVSEVNPETEPGILQCKNFHKYETSDLYPMRESMYEGVPAKIPYKYHEILIKEYGQSAMVVKEYEDHNWVPELKLWVPDKERMAETAKLTPEERKKKQDEERSVRQNEIKQDSGRWG
ncbi:mannosylphosphate transferase [Histoplasma capsulatum H143]|uniref:Mannosylphosphate transferase n=1 Tax=Ajellomyces capsulatus (strain H143) TaxID=544712 RepID=C6HFV8_AJECH|nr:mannosylphosphate transferase [Histoplasma capsulatum H143]